MFPADVESASEIPSWRKVANSGQANEIAAAHSSRAASVFCSEEERNSFGQPRHRDLLIAGAEAIKPATNTDGCDRKVAIYGVNLFYPGRPRGHVSRR
jgi:hypothetical protein